MEDPVDEGGQIFYGGEGLVWDGVTWRVRVGVMVEHENYWNPLLVNK